jgi:hypothetical protein
MTMPEPRFDDRREDMNWTWVPGALLALCVVAGVAIWAYTSGELPRTATRSDPDATTGQSIRPPLNPNPARPPAPQQ